MSTKNAKDRGGDENKKDDFGQSCDVKVLKDHIAITPWAGSHVGGIAKKAIKLATEHKLPARFKFNDVALEVTHSDTAGDVEQRYSDALEKAHQDYLKSPERLKDLERQKLAAEQRARDFAAQIDAVKTADEPKMRDFPDPWPHTPQELEKFVDALVTREHDYGTAAYAMSLGAVAAFNYVANVLGTTGFQAGCASGDAIRRLRSIKGPFMFLKLEDMLYPQSDVLVKLNEFVNESRDWLKKEAQKNIVENRVVHPEVLAHWKLLASGHLPPGFEPSSVDKTPTEALNEKDVAFSKTAAAKGRINPDPAQTSDQQQVAPKTTE